MKRFSIVTFAIVSMVLSSPLFGVAGKKRLADIEAIAMKGKPREALAMVRAYLEELRSSSLEPDHPAIGYAAATAGKIASMAGEHEEAVGLFREGLPIITSKLREGRLMVDEFAFSMLLVVSLEQLERPEEALAVLELLQDRIRKELNGFNSGLIGTLEGIADDGRTMGFDAVFAKEEWLVTVLGKLGTLQLDLKQWVEAENSLKEAGDRLKNLHPEKQVQLVKLQEGWEQALREQGKPVRPKRVGRFGNPRVIQFEGTEEIEPEEIHSALARSSVYVLASHPSASFEEYLRRLQGVLILGYQQAGFPDVTVTVDWDNETDRLVAKVSEGIRLKSGEIHIEGAEIVSEAELREKLWRDDESKASISRAEYSYREIEKKKKLPPQILQKAIAETFPALVSPEKPKQEGDEFLMPSSTTDKDPGVWKTGDWVDYRPETLRRVESLLRTAYAKNGKLFPKIEAKWERKKDDRLVDVRVTVKEEGPTVKLGKIHLVGNRINTREDLLQYLDLREGMELLGDIRGRVKRKLFESGRFLGWEVVLQGNRSKPNQMDMLCLVAEHWEAPPLSAPLSREQQAMLQFSSWINQEAGTTSDLVFSVEGKTDFGLVKLQGTVGPKGLGFCGDAPGLKRRFRAFGEWDEVFEFTGQRMEGPSFRAAFPVRETPLGVFYSLVKAFPENQKSPLVTDNVNFGMSFASKDDVKLRLEMDPASALAICGSHRDPVIRFEEGEMEVHADGTVFRFEEKSGRLVSWSMEASDYDIRVTSEEGVTPSIERELKEMSQDVPNWLEGRKASSLNFLALGCLKELVGEVESVKGKEISEEELSLMLTRSGDRAMKRWSPLATQFGEVCASSFGKKKDSSSGKSFSIPFESALPEKFQAGQNLYLLLSFGGFDLLSEHLVPGSWPDLVTREILFLLDGKPFYLEETIETLLEDESMGPLGCLVCARLLQKIHNYKAPFFIEKAKKELTRSGFAKDWTLLMKNSAGEQGIGRTLSMVLKNLSEDQIDGILPPDPPELRSSFKDFVTGIRDFEPETEVEAFAPVMDVLWDQFLESVVTSLVEKTEEDLSPKVDRKLVAGVVNQNVIHRGVVRFVGKVHRREAEALGQTIPDYCITNLLFAQEMWNEGKAANQQFVEQRSETVAGMLGPDGWKQIEAMGLTKAQFHAWIGTQVAANAQIELLLKTEEIPEEKTRDYYQRHPEIFGAAPERLVHNIQLKVENDGLFQRKLINEISGRVRQGKNMKEMRRLFEKEAGTHSQGYTRDKGGRHGWIKPGEEFYPALAQAIGKVKDESLSDVIETSIGGQNFLHLILVSEKQRIGKAKPFQEVKAAARKLAITEREAQRLRKRAIIHVFDEPSGEEQKLAGTEPDEEKLTVEGLTDKVLSGFRGGEADSTESGEEETGLQRILEKIDKTDEVDLYLNGVTAEQGLDSETGMKEAIGNYEEAAREGDRRALLRLAEIYRVGRGVKQDHVKTEQWMEKAAALADLQSEIVAADLLYEHGKVAEAEPLYQTVLETSEQALGRDHRYTRAAFWFLEMGRIEFIGNEAIATGELVAHLRQEIGSSLVDEGIDRKRFSDQQMSELIRTIERFYQDHGYLNIRVEAEKNPTSSVEDGLLRKVAIKEGPRFIVESVTVQGAKSIPNQELQARLTIKSGAPYSGSFLRGDIRMITDLYFDHGFSEARVIPKLDPGEASNRINILLVVKEGMAESDATPANSNRGFKIKLHE